MQEWLKEPWVEIVQIKKICSTTLWTVLGWLEPYLKSENRAIVLTALNSEVIVGRLCVINII